jgi:tetratricopeptide (TPR) repeat protein
MHLVKRFGIAILVVLFTARSAHTQRPNKPFADLIASYVNGDATTTIRTIQSWPDAEVRTAVDQLIASRDAGLEAATVFITDAAADGQTSNGQATALLRHARRLVGAARARPGNATPIATRFVCGWYSLSASILMARGDPSAAKDYVAEATDACPSDPRLRLWQGITAENAGPDDLTRADVMSMTPGVRTSRLRTQLPSTAARTGRLAAAEAYRQALKMDGDYMDAHLRLGELLDRMASRAEARRELGAVIARSSERPLLYLAHLFMGRIKERDGDLRGAVAEYEAARTIGQGCQAAYTALSFVEDRLGDRAKAREIAAQFADLPDEQRFVDPWWSFRIGGGVDVDLLNGLRKAVAR